MKQLSVLVSVMECAEISFPDLASRTLSDGLTVVSEPIAIIYYVVPVVITRFFLSVTPRAGLSSNRLACMFQIDDPREPKSLRSCS
jgi:hypothetical protein